MSQEKVTRYKEEKAKRKETMKKEKRAKVVRSVLFALVPILLVVLLVDSGVRFYIDNLPRPQVDVDYSIMSDFDDSLLDDTKETVK
jgi:hypothetical protein